MDAFSVAGVRHQLGVLIGSLGVGAFARDIVYLLAVLTLIAGYHVDGLLQQIKIKLLIAGARRIIKISINKRLTSGIEEGVYVHCLLLNDQSSHSWRGKLFGDPSRPSYIRRVQTVASPFGVSSLSRSGYHYACPSLPTWVSESIRGNLFSPTFKTDSISTVLLAGISNRDGRDIV